LGASKPCACAPSTLGPTPIHVGGHFYYALTPEKFLADVAVRHMVRRLPPVRQERQVGDIEVRIE
jgi:hypothetical protein